MQSHNIEAFFALVRAGLWEKEVRLLQLEKIDFNDTTINIYNKIRGLSEVPGSYAFLDGKRVKIFNSRIGCETNGSIGEIIEVLEDGIGIRTKDSEIIITDIQICELIIITEQKKDSFIDS